MLQQIKTYEILQSSHPLPWRNLCTLLEFSQPASPGMLFQLIQNHFNWVEVGWSWRTCHLMQHHHSPSCSNCPYTAWMCVLGHCPVEKQNLSPTKSKPDGMTYRCRMMWQPCCLSVPWILNKSQTVSPTKQPHTITPPPPWFTVGTTHVEIIRSPTLRLTKTQRLEPKISHFDRFPPV